MLTIFIIVFIIVISQLYRKLSYLGSYAVATGIFFVFYIKGLLPTHPQTALCV